MARRTGRKRRQGKRTKSGQLSRAGQLTRPSQWVQAQQAKYGNYYSSALGRAYARGLLGSGSEAKARLDAGNKFALRYTKIIGGTGYTCPLGDGGGGSNDNHDPERDRHQQEWLFDAMDRLDKAGARPWLDQLIHSNYTDTGPHWLDACLANKAGKSDKLILDAAIKALDILLGGKKSHKAVDIPLHLCDGAVNA